MLFCRKRGGIKQALIEAAYENYLCFATHFGKSSQYFHAVHTRHNQVNGDILWTITLDCVKEVARMCIDFRCESRGIRQAREGQGDIPVIIEYENVLMGITGIDHSPGFAIVNLANVLMLMQAVHSSVVIYAKGSCLLPRPDASHNRCLPLVWTLLVMAVGVNGPVRCCFTAPESLV
jgi:hypothetical protein